MPAPANVTEFVDLVRKSGLIPEAKLEPSLDRLRADGRLPDAIEAVAQGLVRDGLLTHFQSKQLKLGRYKRFMIGGKYRLLELLGAGGMGAVYLCEHTFMRRLVALKVLPVEKLEDPSSLERFTREARAVAALNHPNIVRAYDIDQAEKLHFLVMEYVDGASLQDVVARHGPLDCRRAAQYIAQSAVGLQYASELGMVHRDIKPGNLLLERTGTVKLLDMGLARFFNKKSDSVTEKYDDKCVLGTADYLAPEQAVSSNVDIRADVYSLGGTLYFLLTGRTPFPDGTIAAKLVAHQTRNPKAIEELRPDVPADLAAVLRKAMAKKPEDRYQTPGELAAALMAVSGDPVDPPPTREMPALCPAVLALTGHSAERGAAARPAARTAATSTMAALRSRQASGKSGPVLPGAAAAAAVPTAVAPDTGSGRLDPSPDAADLDVPIAPGPDSTDKASAAATSPHVPRPAPVPVPDDEEDEDEDESKVVTRAAPPRPKRGRTLAVVGVLAAAAAAVAAFLAFGPK